MKFLKKYDKFLERNKPILHFSIFDWDDNILFMPTKIHLEHLENGEWVKKDVSTEQFAQVRNLSNWRPLIVDGDYKAYDEFRDNGPRGEMAFMEDMLDALDNKKFGPSWKKFIYTLIRGSIFAIITARGHESKTIKNAVRYIINNVLTNEERIEMGANLSAYIDLFNNDFNIDKELHFDQLVEDYLNNCDFVGVSSPGFKKKYARFSPKNPEEAKKIAISDFIKKIHTYGNIIDGDVRVGFSDDDKRNVDTIEKYFNEINSVYNNISFNIYDTSNPTIIGGIKKKI